jgi:Na+-driven multidrug efflux pump
MFPVIGLQMMGGQLFQAIGKPVQASVLSLSRQILFFVPALLFLPVLFESGGLRPIYGVYWAFPISDFCSSIVSGIFVYRLFRAWRNNGNGSESVTPVTG